MIQSKVVMRAFQDAASHAVSRRSVQNSIKKKSMICGIISMPLWVMSEQHVLSQRYYRGGVVGGGGHAGS